MTDQRHGLAPLRLREATAVAEPRLLHEYFERSAGLWADRVALDVPPGPQRPQRRILTYAELHGRANLLACRLAPLVERECVVAVLLPRNDVHLYVAQLAVLKAGAAYTCIDPIFPDEQIREILEDSEAVALLTDATGHERARALGFDAERTLDATAHHPAIPVAVPPSAPWLTPESLAYVIYTSGTTGRPKGVMIEHGSIANLVSSDVDAFALTPHDRVAQGSSASYDSSLEETWLAWACGGTVVVMDDDTVRLGPDLVGWLRRERVTVLCPPPTMLRTTGCADPAAELPELRLLYVGGEALPRDVADLWGRGRRLVNGYGPTECTVTCVRCDVREGETIAIGTPVRGMLAWALDGSLEPVPDGEPGELCMSGAGLARGYRNRPDLTAARFPEHPRLGRIYRTGDLVHRAPDGTFYYHGRIDAQVKLRGYRVELEAIEARLAEHPQVREAACWVQGETLVAFVVPSDDPPDAGALQAALRGVLPPYMVPSRFGFLDDLPKSVGGKLDRKALPVLDAPADAAAVVAPRNALEARIAEAIGAVLERPVSVTADFFAELGGTSLAAAMAISRLRDDPATAGLAVRDLYEARTVAELALRAGTADPAPRATRRSDGPRGNPALATVVQSLWLLLGLALGAPVVYFATFDVFPHLVGSLGLVPFLLLMPIMLYAALGVYAVAAVGLAAAVKRILVGRYAPLRSPVWSGFHVRHWMVVQTARLAPWWLIEGTVFQQAALRALGARIGQRVHIHRGVNLADGGWDLLDIGDDVTLSQDAAVRLVDLEDGQVVVGSVWLGSGSTLDVRSGVAGNTRLEANAWLGALSSLPEDGVIPRGERWEGVPAQHVGAAPAPPTSPAAGRVLPPTLHGLLMILCAGLITMIVALPLDLLTIGGALYYGVSGEQALDWIFNPTWEPHVLLAASAVVLIAGPLTVVLEALAMRALGRVPVGVIDRWSLAYIRVWLKSALLTSAGNVLSGTLMWPIWLRWAGMKLGPGCEISTIIDVVPELIEIGGDTFFADGIYLGGPRVHRGTVTLSPTRLGRNTFLGNHVVIPCGQQLPDDVLLGVSTLADDTRIRPGTSWFGHPSFELPHREVVACDRSLTHEPTPIRYASRLFWELLRFALPILPLLTLPAWCRMVGGGEALIVSVPLASLAIAGLFCLVVLAMKWALLGRVKPGTHPLWSCWCSRWDFLYVAWGMYASHFLMALEGTLLLQVYLRAMGMRIGKRVALGTGFAQVVDPDMLEFGDDATVSCQFQAHTFEDRVLKIDHVRIDPKATVGHEAVLLYGADIGEATRVAAHSVVMKRERLLPGRRYAGAPTRVQA